MPSKEILDNELVLSTIWRFPKIGVPPVIIHIDGIFHYKPSFLGYPHDYGNPHLWHISYSEAFRNWSVDQLSELGRWPWRRSSKWSPFWDFTLRLWSWKTSSRSHKGGSPNGQVFFMAAPPWRNVKFWRLKRQIFCFDKSWFGDLIIEHMWFNHEKWWCGREYWDLAIKRSIQPSKLCFSHKHSDLMMFNPLELRCKRI